MHLAQLGWDVTAGVRRTEDGEALRTESKGRIAPVLLDVTEAAQVAALDGALPTRLDAVVNNAGIAVSGPVEALPLEAWRRQLEVNLIGQVAVTQAVLPRLRESRGRIVFVSSVSGRVATPMTGAYNASKFGLEGMADALRMELAPWGVAVVLVEPAQTDTDMWRQAEATLDADLDQLTPEHRELYAKHIAGARKMIPRSQKMASPAATVVSDIERALTAKRPKARYVVGAGPKVQAFLAGHTPTRMLDAAMRVATGVPRKP
jgi:NAD(P)-dependent dehydrogenase (short-subunit alcohol dehydrogenase family)